MILILTVVLGLIIVHQIYWYSRIGGNLDLYVNNSTGEYPLSISLYLDGEKIMNKTLENNSFMYKNHASSVSWGKHHIVAKTEDGKIENEFYFNVFLAKRIKIEFTRRSSSDINPSFQFYPEILLDKFTVE